MFIASLKSNKGTSKKENNLPIYIMLCTALNGRLCITLIQYNYVTLRRVSHTCHWYQHNTKHVSIPFQGHHWLIRPQFCNCIVLHCIKPSYTMLYNWEFPSIDIYKWWLQEITQSTFLMTALPFMECPLSAKSTTHQPLLLLQLMPELLVFQSNFQVRTASALIFLTSGFRFEKVNHEAIITQYFF